MEKLNKLSLQSYDGSEDPKDFMRNFKLHATMLDWNNNKQAKIPFFLKGKAERIYNALSVDDKKDIDVILAKLEADCSKPEEVLIHEFFALKPKPNETMSRFALSLQDHLSKAIPSIRDTEKTILLMSQLSSFLPEHMRALIQFNSTKTWDELLVALGKTLPHVKAHEQSFSSVNARDDEVQKITDLKIADIDKKLSEKEVEILKV